MLLYKKHVFYKIFSNSQRKTQIILITSNNRLNNKLTELTPKENFKEKNDEMYEESSKVVFHSQVNSPAEYLYINCTRKGWEYTLQMLTVKFRNKMIINKFISTSFTQRYNQSQIMIQMLMPPTSHKKYMWYQVFRIKGMLLIYPCPRFLLNCAPLWTWDRHAPSLNQAIFGPKSYQSPK